MTALKPTRVARVGLFWGLPRAAGFELVSFSRPVNDVPDIGGFKTLDEGHVDLWDRVVERRPWLTATVYEKYPRGRVNQIMETGRFVILADARLLMTDEVKRLLRRFALDASTTDIGTDAHYRSSDACTPSTSR